jgi:hypothetical protein|tara:strand:- start:148 stop:345 length:198 start_codon:yes stop_codon:yes gene_type:complete
MKSDQKTTIKQKEKNQKNNNYFEMRLNYSPYNGFVDEWSTCPWWFTVIAMELDVGVTELAYCCNL